MDQKEPLGRSETIGLLRSLVERYIQEHGEPPRVLMAVGGSAMILHGLRKESDDADFYSSVREVEEIAMDLSRETGYEIDVTSKKNLWGDLVIPDIESDAVVVEQINVMGYIVDVAALSPEALFVVKASSMREKDRNDLPALLSVTSPDKIMVRFASLWSAQDPYVRDEALVNLVSEIQLVTRALPDPSWFESIPEKILKKWNKVLEESGIEFDNPSETVGFHP